MAHETGRFHPNKMLSAITRCPAHNVKTRSDIYSDEVSGKNEKEGSIQSPYMYQFKKFP